MIVVTVAARPPPAAAAAARLLRAVGAAPLPPGAPRVLHLFPAASSDGGGDDGGGDGDGDGDANPHSLVEIPVLMRARVLQLKSSVRGGRARSPSPRGRPRSPSPRGGRRRSPTPPASDRKRR